MKTGKKTKKVLETQERTHRPSTKAKLKPKIQLKTIIKNREKLIQEREVFSQEYCKKCDYAQVCYNNAARKEFNRLHREHKLNFIQKFLRK